MSGGRVVLWFRNDLRLTDNVLIAEASKRFLASNSALSVLPVYCFDPRFFAQSQYGPRKTGVLRAKFLLESVADLKKRLQGVGSDLLVLSGKPEVIIPRLMQSGEDTTVLAQEEVTDEELRVDRAVKRAIAPLGGKLHLLWGHTLFHRDDLPYRQGLTDMPDVFTPFKEACERKSKVRKCFPYPVKGNLGVVPEDAKKLDEGLPSLESLGFSAQEVEGAAKPDPRSVLQFVGGESAGLDRIQHYIWKQDCLKDYFETRNGMIGADYSSKFSAWLAHGCISPRFIYEEVQRYESQRVKNKSTYWLIFELIWRDFFRYICMKHGNEVFKIGGIAHRSWKWEGEGEAFQRWVDGETGQPLVDANMRELKYTGFMSNRGRQNVASFLTQNLNVDWRLGAAYFEETLLDHDVTANWGNWMFAAGLSGGRINKFNILKQSKDYDEDGEYCRLWCPELRNVPVVKVHSPWQMSEKEQLDCNVKIVSYSELRDKMSANVQLYPKPVSEKNPGRYFDDGQPGRVPSRRQAEVGKRWDKTADRWMGKKNRSSNSKRQDYMDSHM